MKKKALTLLLILLGLFGLNVNVDAATAPASIVTNKAYSLGDYGTGIGVEVFYKNDNNGVLLFCEDKGMKFKSGYKYYYSGAANDGFIYILENTPKTGNSTRDYYIQSVATWWYIDYLRGGNYNITSSQKQLMNSYYNKKTNSYAIINLVEGAKKYKQTAGYIKFDNNNVTFTEENGYYISSKISVKSSVNEFKGIKLLQAPANTTIINNNIKNGTGSFQIKVPIKSLSNKTETINITANGNYIKKKAYEYYHGSGWQKVIYDKIYNEYIEVSDNKKINITKTSNILNITKVDENSKALSGAELTLYKGDCTNSTCKDKYQSWISGNSAKVIKDIPVGKYTLVETKTPAGYQTAAKQLVNITSTSGTYTAKMIDVKNTNKLTISKVDENGNFVKNAELTLYKGDCTNSICNDKYTSWTTTNSAKSFKDISVGKYTLVETKTPAGYQTAAKMLINVASDNKNYSYSMIDKIISDVRISKTDITGQTEIPGASLVLIDDNNKEIASWISTTTPHYEKLTAGNYCLAETIAPKGYILNESKICFKLDENNVLYEKDSNGEYTKVDYIKMINEVKKTDVRISKTDITGQPEIPGASLVLTDDNNKEIASWISTTTPHYEKLTSGNYCLTETIAPDGYVLNKTSICFKLNDEGTIYQKNTKGEYIKVNHIKMINVVKEAINISKLDKDTNEYVKGATLVIKNIEGEVIARWTTAEDSYYVNLNEGEYVLSEETAPKGYKLTTDTIRFKIDADGNLYVQNSKGNFDLANGIIMYDKAEEIIVPATGLSSIITYIIGVSVLGLGAIMLYKNEKKC